jgi:hypothetical protein
VEKAHNMIMEEEEGEEEAEDKTKTKRNNINRGKTLSMTAHDISESTSCHVPLAQNRDKNKTKSPLAKRVVHGYAFKI